MHVFTPFSMLPAGHVHFADDRHTGGSDLSRSATAWLWALSPGFLRSQMSPTSHGPSRRRDLRFSEGLIVRGFSGCCGTPSVIAGGSSFSRIGVLCTAFFEQTTLPPSFFLHDGP